MISFRVDSRSMVPPYLQIVRQVRQALRMGVLEVSDKLPTVRDVVAATAVPPAGYEVSAERARIDLDAVYRYLSEQAPWAAGIPRRLFDRAVDHSRCYGLYDIRTGEQAGFCRVITDYATFAYLDDLFVLPSCRGIGLGRSLVQAVLDDRELADVKSWWLLAGSREARALFRRAGFADPEPERVARWMAMPNRSRGYWAASRAGTGRGRSQPPCEPGRGGCRA